MNIVLMQSWSDLSQDIIGLLQNAVGPVGTVIILVMCYVHWRLERAHKTVMESKQGEIDRAVEDRNAYRDVALEVYKGIKLHSSDDDRYALDQDGNGGPKPVAKPGSKKR